MRTNFPVAAIIRGLRSREMTKPRPLWLELLVMVFDKLFLAGALLLVAFCLNKLLEDYRSEKAWRSEVARQTLIAARELTEASYALASRHNEVGSAAQMTSDTLNPRFQAALAVQYAAGNELLAKCQVARTFIPNIVISKFIDYERRVTTANPQLAAGRVTESDLSIVLLDALDALNHITQPLTESITSGGALVLPKVEPAGEIKSGMCLPPVAISGDVVLITPTSATVEGRARGKVLVSWFDFDYQSAPRYSVQPVNGQGFAYGLTPGTTYYYRFVARNECGTGVGELRTFTTPLR